VTIDNSRFSHANHLVRRRHWLLVVLAFHAGSLDVLGFLALQAFTSVQTGNVVLVGLGLAVGDGRLAFHAVTSIASFVVGCVLGAKLVGVPRTDDAIWPRAVTIALMVQFAFLVVFAVSWWMLDSDPGPAAKVVFVAMNAFGMGIQSAAIQRFGKAAESTTYQTGMLVNTLSTWANVGWSSQATRSMQMIVALGLGAACGAVLLDWARWSAPLLQIVTLGLVILAARPLEGAVAQEVA
jgi:uncharacterized membrane protein YoaK (UPF0700 family)